VEQAGGRRRKSDAGFEFCVHDSNDDSRSGVTRVKAFNCVQPE
jgi:hypothetical protein